VFRITRRTLTSQAQHDKMLKTPIPKLISELSVPTVLSQLVSVVYNTADTWFVSQIGNSASAAVGVVFSLMSLIQAFGFGIGMGASSLISRRLGEKRDSEANTVASSAFLAAVIVGLLLTVGCLSFLDNLMRLLGSTETMLPYSRSYGFWILLGAPVMCSSFVLNNILRAEGEASIAMVGLTAGGVLNIFLDPLFIFTFHMGIAGAAIATILSQCVSFVILLSAFRRGKSIVRLRPAFLSRRFSDYYRIFATGFPTICRQGLASLAAALMNRAACVSGDAAVAAMTISGKVYLLVRNVVLGIGQGFQPVAGYNYGAGDKGRTRQAFWFSVLLGSVVCCLAAAVLYLHAGAVVGWFRNDETVISIGRQALIYACMVMPVIASPGGSCRRSG
jgi:putative MATE family efflux protein